MAECQSGDFVLNGGFRLDGFTPPDNEMFVSFSKPVASPEGGGWRAEVYNLSDLGSFIVTAYCFDNSPPHSPQP